jgi:hypothetical protein
MTKDIMFWLHFTGKTAMSVADPLKDLGTAVIALAQAIDSLSESATIHLPDDRFSDCVVIPTSDTLKSKGNE